MVQYLVDIGRLVRVSDDVLFAGAHRRYGNGCVSILPRRASITVAQFRDLFGSSRSYALAFLEEMDRRRITRRMGERACCGDAGAERGGV